MKGKVTKGSRELTQPLFNPMLLVLTHQKLLDNMNIFENTSATHNVSNKQRNLPCILAHISWHSQPNHKSNQSRPLALNTLPDSRHGDRLNLHFFSSTPNASNPSNTESGQLARTIHQHHFQYHLTHRR